MRRRSTTRSKALLSLQAGALAARALPIEFVAPIANKAAGLAGPRLMPDKAKMLKRHLRRAQPDLSDEELDETCQDGFGSYGRYWIESFRMPNLSATDLDRGFSFIGYEKIESTRVAGLGPILVLPHLGGWEWAAAWLGRIADVPVTAVVEKLEPPEVLDWFTKLRSSYQVNVVPLGPSIFVDLVGAVKRTDVVCLLSDRDLTASGQLVEFFDEETSLPSGPALLARRTGAPIIPTAVFFRGRQRICVVGEPIWPNRKGGLRAEVARLTNAYAQELEHLVRQAPEQWHLLEPNWPSDSV